MNKPFPTSSRSTELTNDFSWSPSRHRLFNDCQRRYYYNHYGSWGGWDKHADKQAQLLYRLKKMTSLPMLIGSLVHQTINQVLLNLRKGQPVPVSTAIENTIRDFRRCLEESERGDWRERPSKSTNLFEHYYGETPSPLDLTRIEDRLIGLLDAFYSSPILNQLRSLPSYGWVTQEALDSFTLDGQKVWVSLDLAVREKGIMYIYDWKTGMEHKADKVQLAVYALFATKRLHASLPNLTLRDFYLDSGNVVSVEMDSETVDETISLIQSSIELMLEKLDDVNTNSASQERFPLTDRTAICRQCSYKSVCFPAETNEMVSKPPQQLTLSF